LERKTSELNANRLWLFRYRVEGLHHFQQRIGHLGRSSCDSNTRIYKGTDFGCGSAFSTANNGSSMSHSPSGWRGCACDETGDRLFAIRFDPLRRFFFRGPANLADHDDPFRFRIIVKHFDNIEMGRSVYWISPNANAGRLAYSTAGQLPNRFVSECAASRYDSYVSFFVDIPRSDSDPTAAVGIFAFPGSDDSGTVRPDQSSSLTLHRPFGPHHVYNWNSFCNAHDQIEACIDSFENSVRGKRRWHEHGGRAGARLFDGHGNRIKNRNFLSPMFDSLSPLTGSDPGDDIRAVLDGKFRVARSEFAGDSLDQDFSIGFYENRHFKI
jgi:hypothetical protein